MFKNWIPETITISKCHYKELVEKAKRAELLELALDSACKEIYKQDRQDFLCEAEIEIGKREREAVE